MKTIERLVLDTSAYSHLRQGHTTVIESLAAAHRVAVPAVVLGELDAAFEMGSRTAENRRVLEEFLTEPFVNVLDVTRSTARHYSRIVAALRRAGTPIPMNDVWIAASTIQCHGCLLTFDQRYARIAALECMLLEVG